MATRVCTIPAGAGISFSSTFGSTRGRSINLRNAARVGAAVGGVWARTNAADDRTIAIRSLKGILRIVPSAQASSSVFPVYTFAARGEALRMVWILKAQN